MHRIRSVVLGAACAAAVAALAPAMASAGVPQDPQCTFDKSSHQVIVADRSDVFQLVLTRNGRDFVVHNEGATNVVKCFSRDGSGETATILNTDKITVYGSLTDLEQGGCATCDKQFEPQNDGYIVDQSQGRFGPGFTWEDDGQSEVEVEFVTGGFSPLLTVIGTTALTLPDAIRVGGPGWVNFGTDSDVDVTTRSGSLHVTVNALDGADFITGNGNTNQSTLARTTLPLTIDGGAGNDTILGSDGPDNLFGNADDDYIQSNDGVKDVVNGGAGLHDTGLIDAKDIPTKGLEQSDAQALGTLQVTPRTQQAATNAHLKLSWTHPKAWRALRSVDLLLFDAANRKVGTVATTARGLTGHGAVKVMTGSRVGHHGKTVTASLKLRLPRSLRGQSLRVAVQATDRHGRKQLEPDAGMIRVAK